jgi:RHS repeat-associated protein
MKKIVIIFFLLFLIRVIGYGQTYNCQRCQTVLSFYGYPPSDNVCDRGTDISATIISNPDPGITGNGYTSYSIDRDGGTVTINWAPGWSGSLDIQLNSNARKKDCGICLSCHDDIQNNFVEFNVVKLGTSSFSAALTGSSTSILQGTDLILSWIPIRATCATPSPNSTFLIDGSIPVSGTTINTTNLSPGQHTVTGNYTEGMCDYSYSGSFTFTILPTCVLSSVDGANNTTSIIASNQEGANAALTGTGVKNVINGGYSNIVLNSSGIFESEGGYEVTKNVPISLNLKGVTDFSQHYDVVFNSTTDITPNTFINNSSYSVTSSLGSYRFSFVKKNDGIDRSACPNIPDLKLFVGGSDAVLPPSKCPIVLPDYLCQGSPQNLPGANCSDDIILSNFQLIVVSQEGITVNPGVTLTDGADLNIQVIETPIDPTLPDNQNNWTEFTIYDDYGNAVGASRSYFDVMGRLMQSQVKNIDAGVLLASQPVYDQYGRPSLSTLPAPAAGLISSTVDATGCALSQLDRIPFGYKNNFVIASSGSPYTYKNFDGTYNTSKEFTPDLLQTTTEGTLGWYYSANNIASSTSSMKEPLVAKTDYPFARTEYYNDGTQEMKSSIPPGNVYRGSTADYQHVAVAKVLPVQATDTDIAKWLQMRTEFNSTPLTSLYQNAVKSEVTDQKGVVTYTISDKSGKEIIGVHIDPVTTIKTYSFNFYDDADRLLYSVTPNGVAAYFGTPAVAFADLDKTSYEYNFRGWLLASNEKDAGRKEYKYRKDGAIRFSQNAEQRIANPERYSYTNYDWPNRPVESGEYTVSTGGTPWSAITSSILESRDADSGLPVGTKTEVMNTYYDGENGSNTAPYVQDFVMGKISCTTKNGDTRTWYSYDERGRVVWTAKDIPVIGIKKIEYSYDPNGQVKEVAYQRGQAGEEFYHVYEYDENTRLVEVQTSTVAPVYVNGLITNGTEQAAYSYYLHGPLKRVELADNLQGIDYLYTVEGWLKSINSQDKTLDPGGDGNDVFGMSLLYYSGDYTNPNVQVANPATTSQFYNGNIAVSFWRTTKPLGGADNLASYAYDYDSKYQLRNAYWSTITNGVLAPVGTTLNEGNISYDLNGNINTLQRFDNTGLVSNAQNFNYDYLPNTNQLSAVANVGSSPATNYASYQYNAIGQLKSTTKGTQTSYAQHSVTGLMTGVSTSTDGTTGNIVNYFYDDNGLRYKKQTFDQNSVLQYETYYVHDAAGNNIAVYDDNNIQKVVNKTETYIYGSDRIGFYDNSNYTYELKDHLGSVRALVHRLNGNLDVLAYTDYYPYGMVMQSTVSAQAYRYGYQGQFAEKDEETQLNAFELRMYDPVIGRWMSVDPKRQYNSSYIGMGNNPVNGIDPDGGGMSPIYDNKTGQYIANDNEGYKGKILLMDRDAYNFLSNNGKEVLDHTTALENSTPINYVSPNVAKKVITDVAKQYNKFYSDIKFDINKLYQGEIQVEGNIRPIYFGANARTVTKEGKIKITIPFGLDDDLNNGFRGHLSMTTVEDVWSLVVVHEYAYHGLLHLKHVEIYKKQREHPTFNNLTPYYQEHILNPPGLYFDK